MDRIDTLWIQWETLFFQGLLWIQVTALFQGSVPWTGVWKTVGQGRKETRREGKEKVAHGSLQEVKWL
jgi:hypothetical protein